MPGIERIGEQLPRDGGRVHLNTVIPQVDLKEVLDVNKQGRLRVLIRSEGKHLVAQCLQYDFAVHGKTVDDLKHRLAHVLVSHVILCKQFGKLAFTIPQAPEWYHDEWNKADRLVADKQEEIAVSSSDTFAEYLTAAVRNAEFAIA